MSQAEHFLRVSHEKNATPAGHIFKESYILTGKAAINHMYDKFQSAGNVGDTSQYLQQFKRFAWLLNPDQASHVDRARDDFIRCRRADIGGARAIADGVAANTAAASSSQAIVSAGGSLAALKSTP